MREEISSLNVEAIEKLIRAYGRILDRLQGDIDSLMAEYGDEGMSKARFSKLGRFQRLKARIQEEMQDYQAVLKNEISEATEIIIEKAGVDALELMRAGFLDVYGINGSFNRLPREEIITLLGFLREDSPLYKKIEMLAPYVADKVSETILEGVGLGYNPRKIAREINRAFGISLTESMRMVRTVQLWSYREATRANYLANDDIISGWIWWSALIPGRTCMSCVAMHGTRHSLDEVLNDHYNGLCTEIPIIIGMETERQSGIEWFNEQDEVTQRTMMGPAKYTEWNLGNITIEQMSQEFEDDVYGIMRNEASLKSILENIL